MLPVPVQARRLVCLEESVSQYKEPVPSEVGSRPVGYVLLTCTGPYTPVSSHLLPGKSKCLNFSGYFCMQ